VAVTFIIPHSFLRSILAELRRRPYHVAVGEAGLNALSTGDIEVLAWSFRFVHEGALLTNFHIWRRIPYNEAPAPQGIQSLSSRLPHGGEDL
jgi:hypothetical protein